MIEKYKSSKTVIAKVFRDSQIQRVDWVNDAIEWIGEALDAIGSFAQTVSMDKITKTYSHKTILPIGLLSVQAVYTTREDFEDKPQEKDFNIKMSYGDPSSVDTNSSGGECETFIVTGGYLHTSFEQGWIWIKYQGMALEDGYPKVPDKYEFDQALYWYIMHKLIEGGFKHPAGINYFQARSLWLDYCGQARNIANMPSVAEAERLRDVWVSLLPTVDPEVIRTEAVDARNLIADTFGRYTIDKD